VFICFEGIDGAGKTTQARMLYQALKDLGVKTELVADPGTTKIGTAIRQILLHNNEPITPIAQMLLNVTAIEHRLSITRWRNAVNLVV